jgi:hypothetical protein
MPILVELNYVATPQGSFLQFGPFYAIHIKNSVSQFFWK